MLFGRLTTPAGQRRNAYCPLVKFFAMRILDAQNLVSPQPIDVVRTDRIIVHLVITTVANIEVLIVLAVLLVDSSAFRATLAVYAADTSRIRESKEMPIRSSKTKRGTRTLTYSHG